MDEESPTMATDLEALSLHPDGSSWIMEPTSGSTIPEPQPEVPMPMRAPMRLKTAAHPTLAGFGNRMAPLGERPASGHLGRQSHPLLPEDPEKDRLMARLAAQKEPDPTGALTNPDLALSRQDPVKLDLKTRVETPS